MDSRIVRSLLIGAAGAALVASLGCSSTKPAKATAQAEPVPKQAARPQPQPEPKADPTQLGVVYFDLDQAHIRGDAASVLRGNARVIQANPDWGVVTVEGHCDERGSSEYNIALGERRAVAVKRYLEDLGVPTSRLETRTFGEGQPAVAGHDESAWRYNRRTEFRAND